jgi:hypothetical protein
VALTTVLLFFASSFPTSFTPLPVLFMMVRIVVEDPFRHSQISIIGKKIEAEFFRRCGPGRKIDLCKADVLGIGKAAQSIRTHPRGIAGVLCWDRPSSRMRQCA